MKLEKRAINEKESEGPVSFSENGEKAVFARNNIKNGTSPLPNGGMKQDLFTGNLKGAGLWDAPKALEVNGTEYSAAYPSISPDGKTIYFASDMPGGTGGFDIYKIENLNGKWTAPVNLGEGVNTTGDEITPFVEGDVLYFSSNWYEGYGGFDVFETNLKNENAAINNLGTAVNSSGDDFGFIYSTAKKQGFLTSNRSGGKGMEDLYIVVRDAATPSIVEASTPPVKATKTVEKTAKMAENNAKSPENAKNVGSPVGDLIESATGAAGDLKEIQRQKAVCLVWREAAAFRCPSYLRACPAGFQPVQWGWFQSCPKHAKHWPHEQQSVATSPDGRPWSGAAALEPSRSSG